MENITELRRGQKKRIIDNSINNNKQRRQSKRNWKKTQKRKAMKRRENRLAVSLDGLGSFFSFFGLYVNIAHSIFCHLKTMIVVEECTITAEENKMKCRWILKYHFIVIYRQHNAFHIYTSTFFLSLQFISTTKEREKTKQKYHKAWFQRPTPKLKIERSFFQYFCGLVYCFVNFLHSLFSIVANGQCVENPLPNVYLNNRDCLTHSEFWSNTISVNVWIWIVDLK